VSEYRIEDDPSNPGQKKKVEKDAKIPIDSEAKFKNVLGAIADGWRDAFMRKQALRDKLKSLATIEEIQNFDPGSEWPICLEAGYLQDI